MMKLENATTRRYLRQVKRKLPGSSADRAVFLGNLAEAAAEMCGEHPEYTLAQYYEQMGTPEQAAETYLKGVVDSMSFARAKRRRNAILAGACFVVVLAVGVLATVFLQSSGNRVPVVEAESSGSVYMG